MNYVSYADELKRSMTWLGSQKNTVFLGQAVVFPGTTLHQSLAGIPAEKKIEFPVAENLQLGTSVGLSLQGYVPISIYPRWNFLLLAADQLVNHLDKLPIYSDYEPKVIIRVAAGAAHPLDPGPQHTGNFTEAFRLLLSTVRVVQLFHASQIFFEYQTAYNEPGSTILVESGELSRGK